MKRKVSLFMALVLAVSVILSVSTAFALNYSNRLGNDVTFETVEEARVSIGEKANPALENYPAGTTFIYRSANLYGRTAATRMNTNLLVFTEESFDSKDAAMDYLKELGVIDIIDEATGSVVLVTPIDNEKGYGNADEYAYYLMQTAMYNSSFADFAYFGGFSYRYVIGIGAAATFLNEYIASEIDYVSRIAGMLLIGGNMNTTLRSVASFVPICLVNATQDTVEAYIKANGAEAYTRTSDREIFYHQAFPLRKVVVMRTEQPDVKQLIRDVYESIFIKAMRIPVLKQGLNSAGTAFKGYGNDEAPYSLCERNALVGGKTEDGIYLFERVEDRFASIITNTNEYLQTWYEFLPEEVLNNTAPAGTIPLILANHGGGDDPVQFVDEIGLLDLIGKERIAIAAPYYQTMYAGRFGGGDDPTVMCRALCALVHYMLDTYPALDASRVYVTGYSLGGGATFHAIMEEPKLFAAAIPMSAAGYEGTDEQKARFKDIELPLLLTTSSYDLGGAFNQVEGIIAEPYQKTLNTFLGYNNMVPITFDFNAWPISGFRGDLYTVKKLNGEYTNHTWFVCKDGVPIVGVNYTENLIHALYPEFGKLAWDWAKHFSRDTQTGTIVYDAFVK